MSSIINKGSILYSIFKTSFWAQDHKTEKSFCSPRERICFASMLLIKNLISALWGPTDVDFLLRSFFIFSSDFFKDFCSSQPWKKWISIQSRKSKTLAASIWFSINLKYSRVFLKKLFWTVLKVRHVLIA